MSQFYNINVEKAKKNWAPILDYLGVKDETKREWMSIYGELHPINESIAYVNYDNTYGMGPVMAPQIGGDGHRGAAYSYTGNGAPMHTGVPGSGDMATGYLPIAMKIAAKTIGLDLVAVKVVNSIRVELPFMDFVYDNNPQGHGVPTDENPMLFKLNDFTVTINNNTYTFKQLLKMTLNNFNIKEVVGGLEKRIWVKFSEDTNSLENPTTTEPTGSKAGYLEFLGFSRIDGYPIFRAYRQANTASAGGYEFNQNKNTFSISESAIEQLRGSEMRLYMLDNNDYTTTTIQFPSDSALTLSLVSAIEDHIPGFVANWNLTKPMSRQEEEQTYSGAIGVNVFTKSVAIGTIEITSQLKRSQVEDIKALTGYDIYQKIESVLINELSQKISRDIVAKIKELAHENRNSHLAPKRPNGKPMFDFDVDDYLSSDAPGGEVYYSIQRKLINKILQASAFIDVEGRIGPAQYIITSSSLAAVIADISKNNIIPADASFNNKSLYPYGTLQGITVYVDPYMRPDDMRVYLGRKNKPDEPGIVFLPFLLAEKISVMSESTFTQRIKIRSRYAVTEVGFFPWKQFFEIQVTDSKGVLV